jgi:pimeloyl-ACP methyl ester carboxylesterase
MWTAFEHAISTREAVKCWFCFTAAISGQATPARARDGELNFDRLAEWFRVIAVDKLEQGHTDNPKRDEDYTMAATVRHAYRFLLMLGLKDVHVIGHSRAATWLDVLLLNIRKSFDPASS